MSSASKNHVVADETAAIQFTGPEQGAQPHRSLEDFIFCNSKRYKRSVEMYDAMELFICATILPLDEESMGEEAVRCEHFGKIDSWEIRGYERGSSEIWVSTATASYLCSRPARDYKKIFEPSLRKAVTCIEVYKKLSQRHGGNPELSLDQLLSQVVQAISGCEIFSKSCPETVNKDYVISLGCFIYHHLTRSDKIIGEHDQSFTSLPFLVALRYECKKSYARPPWKVPGHMVELALGTQQRTLRSGTKDGSSTKKSLTASEETLALQYIVLKQVWAKRPIEVLKNFIFVNSHGEKKSLEMYKEQNLYIADIDPINGKGKLILSWEIFGLGGLYPPSIWLSTYEADYTCIDPAPSYKECFNVTFRKVLICGLVFKILSAANRQNPKLSLDELLSSVVVSLRENEYFSGSAPSKDYIISLGSFIHNRLTRFDEIKGTGQFFTNLPILVALRDECERRATDWSWIEGGETFYFVPFTDDED